MTTEHTQSHTILKHSFLKHKALTLFTLSALSVGIKRGHGTSRRE